MSTLIEYVTGSGEFLFKAYKDGGGTWWLNPEKRYVTGIGTEIVLDLMGSAESEKIDVLIKLLCYAEIECADGVGVWLHEDKIYFDVIKGYDTLEFALAVARECDEISIYDTVEKKTIYLGTENEH